jgi:hypothetical protein
MTEPLPPYDPYAAKGGGVFRPHIGCRCTDEAVKELAVHRQLRIRRRHLERASSGPIAKYFGAPKPCPTRASSAVQIVRGAIRLDTQERFGLAELRVLLPSGRG